VTAEHQWLDQNVIPKPQQQHTRHSCFALFRQFSIPQLLILSQIPRDKTFEETNQQQPTTGQPVLAGTSS